MSISFGEFVDNIKNNPLTDSFKPYGYAVSDGFGQVANSFIKGSTGLFTNLTGALGKFANNIGGLFDGSTLILLVGGIAVIGVVYLIATNKR